MLAVNARRKNILDDCSMRAAAMRLGLELGLVVRAVLKLEPEVELCLEFNFNPEPYPNPIPNPNPTT
jgi:hypothetical protein